MRRGLGTLCDALWAPTAGNAAGVRFNVIGAEGRGRVLRGRDRRAVACALATLRGTTPRGRGGARDARPGTTSSATASPTRPPQDSATLTRGRSPTGTPTPRMATMALLLLLEESGWQATLWGSFRHDEEVLSWAGIDG